MLGWSHARVALVLVVTSLLATTAPAVGAPRTTLPVCGSATDAATVGAPRLRMILDPGGGLVGHRLEVRGRTPIRLGRIAFLDGPFGDRWVSGSVEAGRTRLRIVDAHAGCVDHESVVPGLVFTATIDPSGASVFHDLVEHGSRDELGVWRRAIRGTAEPVRVLQGVGGDDPIAPVWDNTLAWTESGELAAESCSPVGCVARLFDPDGGTSEEIRVPRQGRLLRATPDGVAIRDSVCTADPCPAWRLPRSRAGVTTDVVSPRPVPESESDTWADDRVLSFRWGDATPPAWMRGAMDRAADDVADSRRSNAATFRSSDGGAASVRVTESMPSACLEAIACATRDIPDPDWTIRFRPHGYELNWGGLEWCEAYDAPRSGCLGVRRVMIHELGHIEGLAHPETAGWSLGATQTVMHAVSPSYPKAGWALHEFGPCDAARLQRRYGLPSASSLVASCTRVETSIGIDADDTSITYQDEVTISARLAVRDRDGYGRLGGQPLSGRDVVVQRRVPGGTWYDFSTYAGPAPGTYVRSFRPTSTYEYRMVFDPAGSDGVEADASATITVSVAPCAGSDCPLRLHTTRPRRDP